MWTSDTEVPSCGWLLLKIHWDRTPHKHDKCTNNLDTEEHLPTGVFQTKLSQTMELSSPPTSSECSQRRLVRIFSKQWRGWKSSTHDKEDCKTTRSVPGINGLSCNTCTSYTAKTMSVDHGTPYPNSDPSTGEKSSSAVPVAHQEGSTAEWQARKSKLPCLLRPAPCSRRHKARYGGTEDTRTTRPESSVQPTSGMWHTDTHGGWFRASRSHESDGHTCRTTSRTSWSGSRPLRNKNWVNCRETRSI